MTYISPEVILEAKQIDLLTYLKACEPSQLVRVSGNTYCTKEHDSLKISNGKWMWWSRGIGGKTALDYLIKVQGYSFLEAVQAILGNTTVAYPVMGNVQKEEARAAETPLMLPEKCKSADKVTEYLFGRGIDYEIINYCLQKGFLFESLPYHNAVFVGFDENGQAKYAAYRATNSARIMGDCSGSKKQYSFRISDGNGRDLHLFECAIDLLSYATLMKLDGEDWRSENLVSLSGVYQPKRNIAESKVPVALEVFLEQHPNINRIVLHFDNDTAGRRITEALKTILPDRYEVVDDPPPCGKDVNDFLCSKLHIRQPNHNRERSVER